jgi:hypothetical protein
MSNPNSTSGFLLNDGRFIQITHESHRYVERTLWKLGIVKKLSDGSKDEDAIRISFNTISSFLKYRHEMSDAQIVELVKASEWIKRFYLAAPNSESVQNVLLQQYAKKLDNGQKFANLCFLKEHLSMFLNEQIQLPIFNNEIDAICYTIIAINKFLIKIFWFSFKFFKLSFNFLYSKEYVFII